MSSDRHRDAALAALTRPAEHGTIWTRCREEMERRGIDPNSPYHAFAVGRAVEQLIQDDNTPTEPGRYYVRTPSGWTHVEVYAGPGGLWARNAAGNASPISMGAPASWEWGHRIDPRPDDDPPAPCVTGTGEWP